MNPEQHRLRTIAVASSILDQQATILRCSVGSLRVLCLLSEVDTALYKVTVNKVAAMLYWHYNTAMYAVAECVTAGWLLAAGSRNVTYTPTLEGLRIAGLVQRAERDARRKIEKIDLVRKPRKYTRKNAGAC